MKWRGLAPRLGVAFGYVVLAIAFSWPLPLHLASMLPGQTGGDTGVYIWNQWVFQHELLNSRNPFTTDQVFSLTSMVDLSQHNYTPFLDLVALPLIPAIGVVAAFNVVYLLITILTALATYLLVRQTTSAGRVAAWLAGAVFAWSPVLVARSTGHISLVAAAPLPVFVLCLIKAERTGHTGWGVLLGLSVAWAAYCDVYFAVYCLMIGAGLVALRLFEVRRVEGRTSGIGSRVLDTLLLCTGGLVAGLLLGGGGEFGVGPVVVRVRSLYTPILVLATLVMWRIALAYRARFIGFGSPDAARQHLKVMAVAALAGAATLSPVLYGLGRRILDGRFVSPPTFWRSSPRGVDLLGLFEPNPNHAVIRLVHDAQAADPTAFVDYTAALSLCAIAVVGLALVRGHRPSLGWRVLAIGFAALALGPFIIVAGTNTYIPGPWALLRYVPVVSLARSPARFAIVAALGLSMLFALALDFLQKRSKRPHLVVAAVGLILIAELCPAPRTLYGADVPTIYRRIAADPRPVRVIELPLGIRDGVTSIGDFSAQSQYFQTLHGKRLIGGYVSRVSQRRVEEMRGQPTLGTLLTLSEGGVASAGDFALLKERAVRFLTRSNLGYVVIDHSRASPSMIALVKEAWQLVELERSGETVLYRPTLLDASAAAVR